VLTTLMRIKERQEQGINVAKAQSKHLGRPKAKYPKSWDEHYKEWKSGKRTAKATMEILGLKNTTFYKLVKLYEMQK
jgi:DNA invertase Pin-like site-specific DNA recombinase